MPSGSAAADPPAEVAAFLAAQPEARRADLLTLHQLIRREAPRLTPKMWGTTIGYGQYRYRYESGREGEFFVLGLCPRKSFLALYVTVADEQGYLAERAAPRLGKVGVGKSCINIKKLADLNLAAAAELIRTAAVTRHVHEIGSRS